MICVPVQASSIAELKRKIKQIPTQAQLVEIWIDRLPTDLDAKDILRLTRKKTVIVNKPKREKGSWKGNESSRIERLIQFAAAGANYIDIGIDTNPKLIRKAIKHSKKSKVIISYHNYQQTPPMASLLKTTKKAWSYKPDIVKIATYARSMKDNFRLIHLLAVHSGKKKFIAVGMGSKGIISRVSGLTLGNHINYIAADNKRKSAPGQLTLNQLKTLKDIIKFS